LRLGGTGADLADGLLLRRGKRRAGGLGGNSKVGRTQRGGEQGGAN